MVGSSTLAPGDVNPSAAAVAFIQCTKKGENNENHLKPVKLVFIGKLSLSTLRWIPICQGFGHFLGLLHHFVLTKFATRSIMVNGMPTWCACFAYVMWLLMFSGGRAGLFYGFLKGQWFLMYRLEPPAFLSAGKAGMVTSPKSSVSCDTLLHSVAQYHSSLVQTFVNPLMPVAAKTAQLFWRYHSNKSNI